MSKSQKNKPKKPWCGLCSCTKPGWKGETHWICPLLSGYICTTCCHHELEGGMGASDTLAQVVKITGKTPQEIHAVCRACKHGGPDVGKPGKVIYARPGQEAEILEAQRRDLERLKWLRGEGDDKRSK